MNWLQCDEPSAMVTPLTGNQFVVGGVSGEYLQKHREGEEERESEWVSQWAVWRVFECCAKIESNPWNIYERMQKGFRFLHFLHFAPTLRKWRANKTPSICSRRILHSRFAIPALRSFFFRFCLVLLWIRAYYALLNGLPQLRLYCCCCGLSLIQLSHKKSKKDITMKFQTCVPGLKSVNIVFSITRRLWIWIVWESARDLQQAACYFVHVCFEGSCGVL